MVYPTLELLLALGGRYDDVVCAENHVVGAWNLKQTSTAIVTCDDITGQGHHGTYAGTWTRNIAVDVAPDGAIAARPNGGWIDVPDDSPLGLARNLSLSGGSIDIVVFFRTTRNDATLRCFVQKQETNSGGNGYHAGLQNGALVFFGRSGGVTRFNMARGSVADGQWKRAHFYFDPFTGEARIFINAVQAGSTVTGVFTDLDVTTANLRIGAFTDGSGTFSGDTEIAKVMVGREGNLGLSAALEATFVETDIISDVRMTDTPLVVQRGNRNGRVTDLLAQPGSLTCILDNAAKPGKLAGRYSVGHANATPGFGLRCPVRLRVSYGGDTWDEFRGSIKSAPPTAGEFGERSVSLYCGDWIDTLMGTAADRLSVLVDQYADQVMGAVIDGARRPPPAVLLHPSVTRFPYAGDAGRGDQDKLASEATRVLQSTGALLYQKGDGTVVYEPREVRQAGGPVAGTFTELRNLDTVFDDSRIINRIFARYYPRRRDGTTITLAQAVDPSTTETPQAIHPGQTITLQAAFKDPAQKSSRVGAASVTCTATTDYLFNTAADGTGTNLTSSVLVTTRNLGTMVEWRITNPTTSVVYPTLLRVRGEAIYYDDPLTVKDVDQGSVHAFDERDLTLDLVYEGSLSGALEYSGLIKAAYANLTRPVPASVPMVANRSASLLVDLLDIDLGSRVAVSEEQTGVSASDTWHVQGLTKAFSQVKGGALMTVTWTLAPSWPESLVMAYDGPISGRHNLTFGGVLEIGVGGEYTGTLNRIGDDLTIAGVAAGGGGGHGNADSVHNPGGGGGGGGAKNLPGVTFTTTTTTFTFKVGVGGVGGRPGATGGVTEFRIPASTVYLQLNGGTGGDDGSGDTGGTAGTGGTSAVGAGGTAGGNGGLGGNTGGNGGDAPDDADSAAGGAGGAAAGGDGGIGGDSIHQVGGARGLAGNNGAAASGDGGTAGSGSPGGGGGGGGGVLFGSLGYRGGGGGGGGGATSSNGDGGRGMDGAISIQLAA